jgi:serine/threonine protein kinase/GAF domain-containing protein
MRIPLLARPVLLLATVKVVATLAVLLHDRKVPDGLHLAYVLCFGGAAALLFATGAEDQRATSLGGFFLTVATAFCRSGLHPTGAHGPWADLASGVGALHVDCFMPWFLWTFVRVFPETQMPRRLRRLLVYGARISGWSGGILFFANLLAATEPREPGLGRLLVFLTPESDFYYPLLVLLLLPLPPLLLYKLRRTRQEDGRRSRFFGGALALSLSPALLELTAEILSKRYLAAQHASPTLSGWAHGIVAFFLLPLPFTTAYAILAKRVLPVRLIARRAIQYAFARYLSYLLAAIPFAALGLYLYQNEKIRELLTGSHILLFLATALLGIAAQRYRGRLLESIDRRFFREQYDARQILTLVVQRIRGTHGVRDLAELLCRGIDQALHLETIAVLVEDPRSGNLSDPRSRARKLDASSALAHRIASATDPLTVDLEKPGSPLARLPEADRNWLLDARFRLVVPIVARDGSLLGLIGLGEKKSGLPFLKEDRKLLVDIASSAALGIELELKQTWSSRSEEDSLPGLTAEPTGSHPQHPPENAKECLSCGALYLPYTVFCGNCSRRLEPSIVPYVLPGKFRFERRLGAGGMGVVYRGIDLGLGRAVAVKTLKRVSPEDAMRLRREARTAAAVSHRHLAAVYGLETWQGTPLLIMELMEGGTLTQRIEKGGLSARETVELGIAMAEALEHLHDADILHRDIKPSNIGYTRGGVPKLMDFGIARVLLDLRPERSESAGDLDEEDSTILPPSSIWDHSPTSVTLSRQLVGTLSYLSPEALSSEPPNISFDLWGLAVVLYECVLGRKLFAGMDMKQTMTRIRQGRVPDYEQSCPDLDPALGEFFRSALHRTPSRRPGDAHEMRLRLEEVRKRLRDIPRESSESLPPAKSPKSPKSSASSASSASFATPASDSTD